MRSEAKAGMIGAYKKQCEKDCKKQLTFFILNIVALGESKCNDRMSSLKGTVEDDDEI